MNAKMRLISDRKMEMEIAQARIHNLITHKRQLAEEISSLVDNAEREYYSKLSDTFDAVIAAEARRLTAFDEENTSYLRQTAEEIIQGTRKPATANEKLIARTNEDAGWVLARLDIDHPAFPLVHKCFKEQSKKSIKDRCYSYFDRMLFQ